MLRITNFCVAVSLLIAISCSIVKDSDITSATQLSQLKLTSIEISQVVTTVGAGTSQSGTATVRDSSFKSVSVPIDINSNVQGISNPSPSLVDSVNKHRIISWPVIATPKMLFRSKASSGVVVRSSLYRNGKPRWTRVYENGHQKEYYSFFYDNKTNWTLTNIISRIYVSQPAIDTTVYRDSLIYGSDGFVNSVVRITRKPPSSTATSTTMTFSYMSYGSIKNLGGGPVSYNSTQYNFGNGCYCPSGSNNSCFGCSASFTAANGPGGSLINNATANYIINTSQLGNLSVQIQIEDIKNTNGNNCGGGNGTTTSYDTYYFHPLMLVNNSFSHGDVLLNIYAIDWWQPGTQVSSNTNTNGNESVTFSFNYAR